MGYSEINPGFSFSGEGKKWRISQSGSIVTALLVSEFWGREVWGEGRSFLPPWITLLRALFGILVLREKLRY
jgi:hypothetical protein